VYSILETVFLSWPLVAVLFSLAFMPLISQTLWQKAEWVILSSIAIIAVASSFYILPNFNANLYHSLVDDYCPFIIMIMTLYVLSHGIRIKIIAAPTTFANTIFLGFGNALSSLIGTTGASVLFLPSFLKMNKDRKNKAHLIIFFIFLISNIGGILTPLGDAPILLGYLHGVNFSWSLIKLFPVWVMGTTLCLIVFVFIDRFYIKKEGGLVSISQERVKISIHGWLDIALLLSTATLLFIELPDIIIDKITISHILIRMLILLAIIGISRLCYKQEAINYAPFMHVAKTFLIIFTTIAPVEVILDANSESIHSFLMNLAAGSDGTSIYFWLCAITSAFLDNAPSYMLFFNMAGGNAHELMNQLPNILVAISASAVIMGAITYIGNAPNLMVKSIAEHNGIEMPSFIGYMGWAVAVIVPISFCIAQLIEWLY
jgi:Na+/H+ antiporter NhaD/arsenite permease-like protein